MRQGTRQGFALLVCAVLCWVLSFRAADAVALDCVRFLATAATGGLNVTEELLRSQEVGDSLLAVSKCKLTSSTVVHLKFFSTPTLPHQNILLDEITVVDAASIILSLPSFVAPRTLGSATRFLITLRNSVVNTTAASFLSSTAMMIDGGVVAFAVVDSRVALQPTTATVASVFCVLAGNTSVSGFSWSVLRSVITVAHLGGGDVCAAAVHGASGTVSAITMDVASSRVTAQQVATAKRFSSLVMAIGAHSLASEIDVTGWTFAAVNSTLRAESMGAMAAVAAIVAGESSIRSVTVRNVVLQVTSGSSLHAHGINAVGSAGVAVYKGGAAGGIRSSASNVTLIVLQSQVLSMGNIAVCSLGFALFAATGNLTADVANLTLVATTSNVSSQAQHALCSLGVTLHNAAGRTGMNGRNVALTASESNVTCTGVNSACSMGLALEAGDATFSDIQQLTIAAHAANVTAVSNRDACCLGLIISSERGSVCRMNDVTIVASGGSSVASTGMNTVCSMGTALSCKRGNCELWSTNVEAAATATRVAASGGDAVCSLGTAIQSSNLNALVTYSNVSLTGVASVITSFGYNSAASMGTSLISANSSIYNSTYVTVIAKDSNVTAKSSYAACNMGTVLHVTSGRGWSQSVSASSLLFAMGSTVTSLGSQAVCSMGTAQYSRYGSVEHHCHDVAIIAIASTVTSDAAQAPCSMGTSLQSDNSMAKSTSSDVALLAHGSLISSRGTNSACSLGTSLVSADASDETALNVTIVAINSTVHSEANFVACSMGVAFHTSRGSSRSDGANVTIVASDCNVTAIGSQAVCSLGIAMYGSGFTYVAGHHLTIIASATHLRTGFVGTRGGPPAVTARAMISSAALGVTCYSGSGVGTTSHVDGDARFVLQANSILSLSSGAGCVAMGMAANRKGSGPANSSTRFVSVITDSAVSVVGDEDAIISGIRHFAVPVANGSGGSGGAFITMCHAVVDAPSAVIGCDVAVPGFGESVVVIVATSVKGGISSRCFEQPPAMSGSIMNATSIFAHSTVVCGRVGWRSSAAGRDDRAAASVDPMGVVRNVTVNGTEISDANNSAVFPFPGLEPAAVGGIIIATLEGDSFPVSIDPQCPRVPVPDGVAALVAQWLHFFDSRPRVMSPPTKTRSRSVTGWFQPGLEGPPLPGTESTGTTTGAVVLVTPVSPVVNTSTALPVSKPQPATTTPAMLVATTTWVDNISTSVIPSNTSSVLFTAATTTAPPSREALRHGDLLVAQVTSGAGVASMLVAAVGLPLMASAGSKSTQLGRTRQLAQCAAASRSDDTLSDWSFLWTRGADWNPSAVVALLSTTLLIGTMSVAAVAFENAPRPLIAAATAVLLYFVPNVSGLSVRSLGDTTHSTLVAVAAVASLFVSVVCTVASAAGCTVLWDSTGQGRCTRAVLYLSEGAREPALSALRRLHGVVDSTVNLLAAVFSSMPFAHEAGCASAAFALAAVFAGHIAYLFLAKPFQKRSDALIAAVNAGGMLTMSALTTAEILANDRSRRLLLAEATEAVSLALVTLIYVEMVFEVVMALRERFMLSRRASHAANGGDQQGPLLCVGLDDDAASLPLSIVPTPAAASTNPLLSH